MAGQVPVNKSFFRALEDKNRLGTYRIVHLQQIDEQFKEVFPTVIEENGAFYKASWIRDTDGTVSEYTSQQEVDRAISDLCDEIDITGFNALGTDVEVCETKHGFKRVIVEEPPVEEPPVV
ncbi:MAG: hypothetical protein JXR12_15300 [Neptunomonas phycophila]|uniref:hypothetical protein n=1 Tax=Neptunomonas phycophila TaxID=1572645 RepID=UPI003B8B8A74